MHKLGNGEIWGRRVVARFSSGAFLATMLACGALSATVLARLLIFPPVSAQEPISLTFFGELAVAQQSHSNMGTQAGDRDEQAARQSYVPALEHKHRNLVLIVGDALRSDALQSDSVFTPRINALIRKHHGNRADYMRAACAESSCGLMAIASSRYVHQSISHPISLQEVLHHHGYGIHMILSGDHTNFYGLREAYGEVDTYFDGSTQEKRYMNDDRIVLDRIAALPKSSPTHPVMLQFHLMSTHGLGLRQPEFLQYRPYVNYYLHMLRSSTDLPSELKLKAVNYYRNGVLQFDAMVAQILSSLQRKGYLEDALVVVTADHGELLGEHGLLGHASQPWEEALQIPFVMLHYGHEANPIAPNGLVSQIDVAPSILFDLGIPIPPTWRGLPLQQHGGHKNVFFQQGNIAGLYELDNHGHLIKYWRDWDTRNEYVFDLKDDPHERENLSERIHPSTLSRWRRKILGTAAAIHRE
jgi:hypothetical protein